MTIHGSKGLEFGHVFVAGCGRRLAAGHKEKLLFSERDGLGPLYVDLARSVTKHTYVRLAMERSLRNADLAEEMRLLYVAMTRAARSLVLVAGIPLDPDKGVPALARRIRDAGCLAERPVRCRLICLWRQGVFSTGSCFRWHATFKWTGHRSQARQIRKD